MMEIFGVSAANSIQGNKTQTVSPTSSDANFINAMFEVAGQQIEANIPQVYAGDSKEFEFWLKDEKVASKPFKYRTKNDVLAEIEQIIESLLKEEDS